MEEKTEEKWFKNLESKEEEFEGKIQSENTIKLKPESIDLSYDNLSEDVQSKITKTVKFFCSKK
jgi:hypothetical protein